MILKMIRDWSKEKLEAGIEKTRGQIATLDAWLEGDWSRSEMLEQARVGRKLRGVLDTHLKNMEHVLKEKEGVNERD